MTYVNAYNDTTRGEESLTMTPDGRERWRVSSKISLATTQEVRALNSDHTCNVA
jgi:hypothetical protein